MPRTRVAVLGWIVAIAFVVGTALSFVDQLDLWATPPTLPDGASIVDRVLGSSAYLNAIWPIFFGTNMAFAIGFAGAAAFAAAVASALGGRGSLPVFVSLVTIGGIVGAIGALITVGAGSAHVFAPYCDCASKDTEIVGQVAALTVMGEISDWMGRFAAVIVAVALVAFARETRSALSDTLRTWTLIAALGLVVTAILGIVGASLDPVPNLVQALVVAIVVPIWAIWLGRAVDGRAATPGMVAT